MKTVNEKERDRRTKTLFKAMKKSLVQMCFDFTDKINPYGHIEINVEGKYFIECASGLYRDVEPHYAFRVKGVRSFKHGYDLNGVVNRLLDEVIKEGIDA